MIFYQVVRHIVEEDGSVTHVRTPDISTDKQAMQKIAENDKNGFFAFINCTKTVEEITEQELSDWLVTHMMPNSNLKIKIGEIKVETK